MDMNPDFKAPAGYRVESMTTVMPKAWIVSKAIHGLKRGRDMGFKEVRSV
ncbi:MAG: hypothetical protein H6757_03265 [Candidatus Omnitrophica bacterium]|nr:hypothetical protein [Candidatus Omnitrophota bacterium]